MRSVTNKFKVTETSSNREEYTTPFSLILTKESHGRKQWETCMCSVNTHAHSCLFEWSNEVKIQCQREKFTKRYQEFYFLSESFTFKKKYCLSVTAASHSPRASNVSERIKSDKIIPQVKILLNVTFFFKRDGPAQILS